MPGSFDSDKSPPPQLISSLRSFRFKNKSPIYEPVSSDQSEGHASTKSKRNVGKSPENSNKTQQQTISSTSESSYNPLGYRKYEISSQFKLILPRVINKIQEVFNGAASTVKKLKVNLTPEELNKVKNVILQNSMLSAGWSSNISVSETSANEKSLIADKKYLRELQVYISSVVVTDASVSNEQALKPPVRTYSRVGAKSNPNTPTEALSFTVPPIESHQLEQKKSKGIMDDYEVFCGKELNLRKLLDAFPGADIMEAQDILVKCDWNLENAMEMAQKQPLRSAKKPAPSSSSASNSPSMSSNAKNSIDASSDSTLADEIVLDSSDEESINTRKNKSSKRAFVTKSSITPAPKRVRRISSSDSEDSLSATKSSESQVDFTNKLLNQSNNTLDDADKKEKPFTTPSSLSIQPITKKISDEQIAKPANVPNLPKGLMIVAISNDSSPENNSARIVSNGATISNVSVVKKDSSGVKLTSVSENKSAQLVRISPSNNATGNQSSTKITLPKNTSLNITPINKSISILPVSKGISIIPIEKLMNTLDSSVEIKPVEKEKSKKRKKYASDDDEDEDYGNDLVYDSDDSDLEDNLTSAHMSVLKFFQESSVEELGCIPGCSKKKVEAIINIRPFKDWSDLVSKLSNDKCLSTDLLNGSKKVLDMRNAINKLMSKCQQISIEMEDLVENLKDNKEKSSGYISKQPQLLNFELHLTPYQMLGINWLHVMHNQEVNGILADEMGLGKTIQAIAFLAYLKEVSISGPHLIVVPSSVLDNWRQELMTWWPNVSIICYHGSQENRRELRMQILNDEVDEFDIMITTYNMVTKNAEDRGFFKRIEFHYVVFDEAHMLKNMASQRYQHLMRIKAPRRLLLTGTPLQNNLVELMSLLIFAMPHMFSGKTDHIKQMFSAVSKTDGNKNTYEKERIEHAKRIMKPFILRRLKKDVLQDLPLKHDEIRRCPMISDQAKKYKDLIDTFSAQIERNDNESGPSSSGIGMMMQLRRAANHPLLLRRFYTEEKLKAISKEILKEPNADTLPYFEDMCYMSDFELHRMCKNYKSLKSYELCNENIVASGKFQVLDELLPKFIKENHRVLLFSQFTMVLDIIEEYMNINKYKFLRLDGQVPVAERQGLIDTFNQDPTIFIFLLSTKAGGLGINLTAADTVILHDIDFNPYNDKQAEDRCHRVGQTKDVTVVRLISENTIEEGILQRATEKLKLERDIHEVDEDENGENDPSVAKLLRDALGIKKV